jgi:outer membrane usher protein FimD/PapC
VKVIEISAGVDAPQSIGYSQNMDMGAGWSAGTYRLSLSYAPNQNQASASGAITVHSDTFTVG